MSKSNNNTLLKFVIFIIFISVAVIANSYFDLSKYLSIDKIRALVESVGVFAPIIFISLYAVSILFFLPASPFSVASGVLFGGIFGTIYVVIGATIGAMAAFLLARYLGEDFVHNLVKNKFERIEKYNRKLEDKGLLSVLIVRLIPAFPFTASSFAFGLTKVKFRDFFIATLVGIIPGSYAYVNLGSGLVTMNFTQLFIAIALIIILATSAYIYDKITSDLDDNEYDLIVIGAGAAGLNVASFANKIGLKVLLAEKTEQRIGGDCLNFGCVPSKSLISVARKINAGREAENFGLSQEGELDFKQVKEYIEQKQDKIRTYENKEYFEQQGIDVKIGTAKFVNEDTVEIAGEKYKGRKLVLATGTTPRQLEIPGSEEVKVHDTESIWNIEQLPDKMLMIGAGFVGLELAQAFQYLGSEVHVFERGGRILSQAPKTVSKKMEQNLKEAGVKIHKNADADSFENQQLVIENKNEEKERYDFDLVFASIGRIVNTKDLNLEQAGIETTDRGKLKLKDNLQTTNKKVYVCGDVVGRYQFTHATELHASVVLKNMFSPISSNLNTDHIAWVVYTDPEIAAFGLQKQELEERGLNYQVLEDDFSKDDRAIVSDYAGESLIKLYVDSDGVPLGGFIIAPEAGEMVQELILANTEEISLESLFEKVYPYPTASRITKNLAAEWNSNKLTKNTSGLLRALFRVF